MKLQWCVCMFVCAGSRCTSRCKTELQTRDIIALLESVRSEDLGSLWALPNNCCVTCGELFNNLSDHCPHL